MAAVTILQHRHPCPRCGTRWTHRVAPNVCGAYNGEPLRCGLCQVEEQAPAPPDRRGERIAWVVLALVVFGQTLALVWAFS